MPCISSAEADGLGDLPKIWAHGSLAQWIFNREACVLAAVFWGFGGFFVAPCFMFQDNCWHHLWETATIC